MKVRHEIALQIPRHFRRPACRRRTRADEAGSCYSNEKIFFQSFFMLITVQFFFFASS
jgi:hypothetical protein